MKRVATIAIGLALFLGALTAATLVQLTLSQMITQSTAIEHATVVDSWAAASGPIIYTHYKLKISEQLKGSAITEIVVFGGAVNGVQQTYPGTRQLNVGDDYVFFLWTNKAGQTHIIGLTQGLFAVASDGTSDPAVTRSASTERMLDGKTGLGVKDKTLSMKLSELRVQIASGVASGAAK